MRPELHRTFGMWESGAGLGNTIQRTYFLRLREIRAGQDEWSPKCLTLQSQIDDDQGSTNRQILSTLSARVSNPEALEENLTFLNVLFFRFLCRILILASLVKFSSAPKGINQDVEGLG